jgi:hypothetical protein
VDVAAGGEGETVGVGDGVTDGVEVRTGAGDVPVALGDGVKVGAGAGNVPVALGNGVPSPQAESKIAPVRNRRRIGDSGEM